MLNCPSLPHKLAHAKAMLCVSTHSSSRAVKDKYVPERTPQLLAMTIVGTDCATPIAAVPGGVSNLSTRSVLLLALLSVWGMRLFVHLTLRKAVEGWVEDVRYPERVLSLRRGEASALVSSRSSSLTGGGGGY